MRKLKLFSLLAVLLCSATMWAATGSWTSGSCTVTLTDDGTLTVSGSGAMDTQYQGTTGPNAAPWVKTNAADIKRIVIEEGVTGIGKYSFIALPNLTSVKIANTVQTIGQSAFERCNYLPKIVIPAGVQWIAEDAFFRCTSLTDVYCYPDAATMYYSALDLWNETTNPDFIKSVAKTTKCHVRTGELAGYNDKYGTTLNVTFVGDLLYPTSGTAPTVVEMPNAKALFYTGSTQELISGGAALNGTFEYSTDGTSWSTALPTATEEGEYTVYYRLTGAAGYGSVDYDANNKITASIVSDKGVFQYCYDAHVNPSSYPTNAVVVNDLAEPRDVNSTVAVVNENPRGPWRVVYLGQFDPADESKYGNGVRDQVDAACVAYGEEVNATNRAKKEVYALQQWNGSAWITITNGLVSMYWDGTQDPARFAIFIKGQTSTAELTYLLCDQAQPIHNSAGFGVNTSFPNAKTGTQSAIFGTGGADDDDEGGEGGGGSTPDPGFATGKLTGEFSINSTGGKVNFSSGNLQYLASTNTWRFAENQYDYIGAAPGNNVYTGRATQAEWIDLFCWGTGTNPTYISNNGADFLPGITGEEYEFGTANDWGTAAAKDLGDGWRTLNKAEWLYILEGRDNATNLWTKATVDGKAGLLLLPDGWTADGVALTITGTSGAFTTNDLDLDEWATLQNQGAVFLPAAGANIVGEEMTPGQPEEEYKQVIQSGSFGYYWLATAADDDAMYHYKRANATMFYDSHIYLFTWHDRSTGSSVRLVQDVQAPNTRDDVSGIEDAMAALIGTGATDLTIVRDLYKDGFFNTICFPFSLTASEIAAGPLAGCELYTFTSATYNGGGLDINISSTTEIEAGVPYLIRWENTGEVMTSLLFTGVTVTTSTGIVTGSGEVNFIGTIGRSTLPHGNVSYLFVGEGNNLYWSDSSDATSMKGFRAYFRINNLGGQESVPRHAPARLVIAAPKTPTAVENVQGDNVQSTKVIENGQLFIIKNGIKYNVQGQIIK